MLLGNKPCFVRKQSWASPGRQGAQEGGIVLIPPIMMSIKHYVRCLFPWHMGFVLLERARDPLHTPYCLPSFSWYSDQKTQQNQASSLPVLHSCVVNLEQAKFFCIKSLPSLDPKAKEVWPPGCSESFWECSDSTKCTSGIIRRELICKSEINLRITSLRPGSSYP